MLCESSLPSSSWCGSHQMLPCVSVRCAIDKNVFSFSSHQAMPYPSMFPLSHLKQSEVMVFSFSFPTVSNTSFSLCFSHLFSHASASPSLPCFPPSPPPFSPLLNSMSTPTLPPLPSSSPCLPFPSLAFPSPPLYLCCARISCQVYIPGMERDRDRRATSYGGWGQCTLLFSVFSGMHNPIWSPSVPFCTICLSRMCTYVRTYVRTCGYMVTVCEHCDYCPCHCWTSVVDKFSQPHLQILTQSSFTLKLMLAVSA